MKFKKENISLEFNQYGKLFQIDKPHFEEFTNLLFKTTLKRSEFFLEFGKKCSYLGFVLKGTLRSFYVSNGINKSFNFHIADNFFTNYESVLLNTPSNLYIQAVEDSEILLLDKHDLENLFSKENYWQKYGRIMAERIYLDAHKRIEELLYLTPEQRYVKLLKHNPSIFQKVPQKYIASYLGITPQSLSRIRTRISKS